MGMLDGKVALITGAGTGIGKGTALMFAAEGAKVVIAARREQPLQEVCALAPDSISWVRMDLTSHDDRARALETVVERHGRLDVLVSNAGYQLWKDFADTTDEEIDELFYTNLSSTTRLIKQALPYLENSQGQCGHHLVDRLALYRGAVAEAHRLQRLEGRAQPAHPHGGAGARPQGHPYQCRRAWA